MRYDTLIVDSLREMMVRVTSFIPTLLVSFVILIVGWIFARFMKAVLTQFFKVIGFDKITDKLGITHILKTGEIKHKPSELISSLVYIVLILTTLVATIKSLGLTVASGLIDSLLAYIPNVISGTFVLIIGMLLAKVVSGFVYVTAKNTDMPIPEILSRLTKWAIVAYVTIMYLKEIGFVSLFVDANYTLFMGGVIFALALAFGLAGKDIAAKYLDVFRKKD